MQENAELKELARLDQLDRTRYWLGELSEQELWKRDRIRLLKVIELVEQNIATTAKDFTNAAIVFQHGKDEQNERWAYASGMAVKMMRKAIDLDPSTHRWLLAAAIDRDLMVRNLPQIYGTQYTRKNENAPWEFYTLDPTKITDVERKEYHVKTIPEQKSALIQMNKKKLVQVYSKLKDINKVLQFCKENFDINSDYDFSWRGISTFAFQLIRIGKKEEALSVFQLLTGLYPKEYDPFHSLGFLQAELGLYKEAESSYLRSLELHPGFETAKRDLSNLRSEFL